MTAVTAVVALGTMGLTGFYSAYPEAVPLPGWAIVAAGAALWGALFFLISRIPDNN